MRGAGVRLDFSLDSINAVAAMQRVESLLVNTALLLDTIGGYLDSDLTNRFYQGVAPDGTDWLESKRAKEEGGKTLVKDGHLRDSVTHVVNGDVMTHGVGEIYGAIHHFGGKAGRNHSVELPARPIVGIDVKQHADIANIYVDFVSNAWH